VNTPTLAVTGSTGALGGMVARDLAARGMPQRLLVRVPDRAPALAGATAMACSYGDGEAARTALDGVSTLLMVSAAENAERLREHRTFVDAAADAGVHHVVYTSFAGAAPDCTFTLGRDHWATEEHIRARGLTFTFLRDNFYLDFLPMMTGDDGVIRGPAGEGRMAGVARADVARSAVAVLLDPEAHAGTTYTMTGPEALTLAEAAAILSQETRREISFHDETVAEAYASRRRWDAPQWQYDAWVSTYTAIRAGEVAEVTDDVRRLTGREPLGLRDLLRAGTLA
jgi:uncharacterized protein YbjT (DUF2867 family)